MVNTIDFKNRLTLGVIDSGVGGLSVLRPLVETALRLNITPSPRFIYLADTQRFPYGQRSQTQIREFAAQMLGWLAAKECQVAVVACHTISSLGVSEQTTIPVYDMAAIGSWLTIADSKRIVVLSTPATADTAEISKSLCANYSIDSILEIGCPELASIIERGVQHPDHLHKILNNYAEQIIQAKADTVILGCTHYPFIADSLAKLLPSQVKIIDPAIQFTDYFFGQLGFQLHQNTQAPPLCKASNSDIEIAFHVTGSQSEFKSKLSSYVPDLHGTVAPVTIAELEEFSTSKLQPTDLMSA
jgi:glutamate racemase